MFYVHLLLVVYIIGCLFFVGIITVFDEQVKEYGPSRLETFVLIFLWPLVMSLFLYRTITKTHKS